MKLELPTMKASNKHERYLITFFEEKDLAHKSWDIEVNGLTHFITNEAVIENILLAASEGEQEQIAGIIRKIDFLNGDINHFLAHLAKGLAANY